MNFGFCVICVISDTPTLAAQVQVSSSFASFLPQLSNLQFRVIGVIGVIGVLIPAAASLPILRHRVIGRHWRHSARPFATAVQTIVYGGRRSRRQAGRAPRRGAAARNSAISIVAVICSSCRGNCWVSGEFKVGRYGSARRCITNEIKRGLGEKGAERAARRETRRAARSGPFRPAFQDV